MIELPALSRIFETGQNREYSRLIKHGLVDMNEYREDSFLFNETETNLHMTLVKALNNQKINAIYEQIRDEVLRVGMMLIKAGNGSRDLFDKVISDWEHLEKALRENDREEALSVYKSDHLSGSLQLSVKSFETE